MPKRTLKPSSILTLILPVVMMIVLLTGCGTDRTSITGSSDGITNGSEFRYPEITPEQIADGPAAGYRFFTGAAQSRDHANTLDDPICDSLRTSRNCNYWSNTTVGFNNLVTVRISRGDISGSANITVVAPLGNCAAVADFYPHPYQFNGIVEITWYLDGYDLPNDFDYDSLVPFYVNDDGVYEPMPFTWYNGHDMLVVYTNHFSRYIIGQKTTNSGGSSSQ